MIWLSQEILSVAIHDAATNLLTISVFCIVALARLSKVPEISSMVVGVNSIALAPNPMLPMVILLSSLKASLKCSLKYDQVLLPL